MSNTLTNLIPSMYEAKDTVLRELTGYIPAVTMDASGEEVALNQSIIYPVVGDAAIETITPAATGPDPADSTVGNDSMTISNEKSHTFYLTANDMMGLGSLRDSIIRDKFAQAMRKLVNAVEADLAALYVYASRAYGVAGTTPFGTNLAESAQMLKILKDNGVQDDLQMVIDTTAGASLRTLTNLTKANEAGGNELLRRGVLLDIHGFAVRESAQVKAHTKGAGTGYLVDLTAGYAAATTTVHLDTGTGQIKAGDILTNSATGRDTNKYVVKTGGAGGEADYALANPGLLKTWNNNDAVAIGNSYIANMAFARSAIHLLLRVPAMPEGGDAADDITVITDDQTGISFQVAMYRQRRRVAYEVGLAWGVKAVKPEAIALLLG